VSNKAALVQLLSDPTWRLCNLYKIIAKDTSVIQFVPNPAQRQFLVDMHTRNVIPKARQRGLSTMIQILMLDSALFTSNFKGRVIAQDEPAATEIFRDKLKFAYMNLPEAIRDRLPLQKKSETELIFPNGSSVAVTTSARSGTVQMLHVSEFGKIAAKYPGKAREVITGSIPAVPPDGLIFVESTAEGQDGSFYKMVQTAKALQESGKKLTPLDFKLHFYSWWDADEYQIDPEDVVIETQDREYFDDLEQKINRTLGPARRAWYVKARTGLEGDQEKMWQEYPSTVDEAFQVSTEGTYYAEQFKRARKENRICRVPYDPSLPVSTFWDIGQNDETAIWCVQQERRTFSVINYVEETSESFSYFVGWLKDQGYTWHMHFLPHDATHKRQQGLRNQSAEEMIQELAPGWRLEIVPRIPDVTLGIRQTRDIFPRCYFDEEKCAVGLRHLELYKKEWDKGRACWKDIPRHDAHSNGADAFRQLGQAVANDQLRMPSMASSKPAKQRNWKTA
jgi:hypothetical protein